MLTNLHPSWQQELAAEFEKDYFKELNAFVKGEYEAHTCFPPQPLIFNAFNACPLDEVKVVILGQDPYHGLGQANGLSFSVNDGVTFPPSLVNIFKELQANLDIPIAISGNLERWAAQGVLLLNATLTVREGNAGSHQKRGWEVFTDAVISALSRKKTPIIFLLWGGYAKKKGKKIDKTIHDVLESGHPSPLSANRGYWFGNGHFGKVNTILRARGEAEISW